MHDPQTVAFDIKYPWWQYRPWPKGVESWSEMKPRQQQRRSQMWRQGYRSTFITIWHVDPERDDTDDSCGWFMRSRHGDKATLERIVKRFAHDWDGTFTSEMNRTYLCGFFKPSGEPNLSVQGIVLNLFFLAACEVLNSNGGTNWERGHRYVKNHLSRIMLFAENPTDSLRDAITRKFEIGCGEAYTEKSRDERLRSIAACIYSWILRSRRPWYRHPRWHIHHWKIQCHPIQQFKRWAFSRCETCGRGFKYGESPVSSQWDSDGPKWFRGERHVQHMACSGHAVAAR